MDITTITWKCHPLAWSMWMYWWSDGHYMMSRLCHLQSYPDSKVHGANMGPIWVLSAPDGPHVGTMNLAIRVYAECLNWGGWWDLLYISVKGQYCSHAYMSRQQHRHGRQKYLTTQPYNIEHAISIYMFVGQCFLMKLMGIDGGSLRHCW